MSSAPIDTSSPPVRVATAGPLRRNRGKLIAIAVLLVAFLLVGGFTAATLSFSYSTGERVGFVQKLSKKGWLCHTWEGELAMSPVPGAPPQLFACTVPDVRVTRASNIGL